MEGSYLTCLAQGGDGLRLSTANDAFGTMQRCVEARLCGKSESERRGITATPERANPTLEDTSEIDNGKLVRESLSSR